MTLVAACRGARPGLARGLGGREGHTARGPGGSSQLLNHGGIYLANKFNDQFVLVTVALPQINYSKFKLGRISQKYRFRNFFWGLEKKELGKVPWALLWERRSGSFLIFH